MKIGFALPNIGPVATAEAVVKVAQRAEALAYDSLWTIERLLWPVKPQTPYPVSPDGLLPEFYKYSLDPLDTLTFAAAHTKTITLGTSVLDIPYHNPVTLGRRAASCPRRWRPFRPWTSLSQAPRAAGHWRGSRLWSAGAPA